METVPRLTDRAAFDRLLDDARRAVSTGTHRLQTPPVEGGPRWGLSALLRPDAEAAGLIDAVAHEAAEAAGGSAHWLTGAAASSHLTVRSLEPFRESVPADDPLLERYAAALAEAAAGFGPLTFDFADLTLTPSSVMACATPADDAADRFAAAYTAALGPDGWHEAEFRRDLWYLNLVHFAAPIPDPDRLLAWAAEHRRRELATVTVTEVEIAQWIFDGDGMRPRRLAAAPLTPLGAPSADPGDGPAR